MPTKRKRPTSVHRKRGNAATLHSDAISRVKLGKELIDWMRRTGISQTLMAKLVDDAPTQISRLANHHYVEFSADRIARMLMKVGYRITVTIKRPKGLTLAEQTPRATVRVV